MDFFTIYLLLINALALVLMLVDKIKAKNNLWRIPERTLMLSAALGGSVGALIGMYLFRHKTRHPKFIIGIPATLVAQIFLGIWIFSRFGA